MKYQCDVEFEAYFETPDGATVEFWFKAELQCPVRDDTFTHQFGTETVAPYPDESYIEILRWTSDKHINLGDAEILKIIREQYGSKFKWY